MEIILVLIVGMCIGSFLNVCIYRIPREESIAFPPSHCTNCGYELRFMDLIPIISYIFLRGKCKKCEEKISLKYPVIECINGLVYILLFINYGYSFNFFKLCILLSLLIVIGVIDYETKYVYNSTIIFGVITALIFLVGQWIFTKNIPWSNIIGGAIGFLLIWLIVVLTHGMGEGDADIALVCGLFLGVKGAVLTLFIAFVLGGIIGVALLLLKLKNRKDEIAFGPYLSIGGIISALFGQGIVNIYMGVFLK